VPVLSSSAAAAGPPLAGASAAADRQMLERVVASSGVERIPRPPDASYLGDAGVAIQRFLLGLAARGGLLRVSRPLLVGLVILAVAAAVLLLLFQVLLPAWRKRRRRRQGESSPGEDAASESPAVLAAGRDATAWRAELDRCLAEGRVTEGLEAAWWWLARSVAGAKVEPTWTGRDLLARTRRDDLRGPRDLRDLVRRLDVLLYGPARPGLDDLRRLVGRIEETLA
jgi:hypothetical protein